jgi:serine protease
MSPYSSLRQRDNSETKRVFVKCREGNHQNCYGSLNRTTRMMDPSSMTRMYYDFPDLDTFVMEVATEEELLALQNDPNIEEIVEDAPRYPMHLPGSVKPYRPQKSSNLRKLQSPPQQIPYGVEMVKAPEAWSYGIRGAGVKVCIIDSGTDMSHEDLNQETLDGISSWYQDNIGHGTHVAGTVAAVDNDVGVVGVAPEAEIFTVKLFSNDSGFAFASSLVNAAFKCRDAGAKIIGMSLGGPLWNPFEFWVFGRLLEQENILSIAAAGLVCCPSVQHD